jgi:hypothetical protein
MEVVTVGSASDKPVLCIIAQPLRRATIDNDINVRVIS